jgi:hypothetical protein
MRHGIALNKIHLQQLGIPSERFGVQICTVGLLVGELVGGGFVGYKL